MAKSIYAVGTRIGKLVAVEKLDVRNGHRYWRFHCDCGNEAHIAPIANVRARGGSCGCIRRSGDAQRKHGGKGTRLYSIWYEMRRRCRSNVPRVSAVYKDRGIAVAPEWEDFRAFREWALASGYNDALELDRADNSLGYCPTNCRWATRSQQMRNLRSTRFIEWEGERLSVPEIAERTGLTRATILARVKAGWNAQRIMTTPLLRARHEEAVSRPNA